MSTDILTMQPFHGYPFRHLEFNGDMTSHASNPYGTQEGWIPPPPSNDPRMIAPNQAYLASPQTMAPAAPYAPGMTFAREPMWSGSGEMRPSFSEHDTQAPIINTAGLGFLHTASPFSSPALFTAANATTQPQQTATLPPLQIQCDHDEYSPTSSGRFPFAGAPHAMHYTADSQYGPYKNRNDSLHTSTDGSPPTKTQPNGGRRRSEGVVKGSVRAMYLEKNRQAASKCRNKQKQQHLDLAENARHEERRNRLLRLEVAMLSDELRELKNLAFQHIDCPDGVMKQYLHREADRLAAEGSRASCHLPPAYQPPPASNNLIPQRDLPPEELSSPVET
jgi:hypothetical protein